MKPPRAAAALVGWLAGRDERPFVLSDLAEEFEQRARRLGPSAARRWYWRQALGSIGPLVASPLMQARLIARVHVRQSLRLIYRAPVISLAIVATMALGIGANTAVFSVVDAVLLQPLPYRQPDRLVSIWEHGPGALRMSVSMANFADYERSTSAFEGLATYARVTRNVGEGAAVEEIVAEQVSWNFFDVLGVPPEQGRHFGPDDSKPGAEHVVIAAATFARRTFGDVRSAVGRVVLIDGRPHVVVGVMPQTFRSLSEYSSQLPVSVFVPASSDALLASREDHEVQVVGRLRPGATVELAQRDLDRVTSDLARTYPDSNGNVGAMVAALPDDIARNVRQPLLILLAAVGAVLLIACTNIAHLLIVWATGQRRDVSIRLALGAGRADVIAEFVVRGLVFAVLGGVAGVALGIWVRDALIALAPASVIPRVGVVELNVRVLLLAAASAATTGLAASIVPALHILRGEVVPTLGDGARSVAETRTVTRLRGVLLLTEVAAAVVLALGAGLFVRSLLTFERTDLGFETDRTVTMDVRLPVAGYPDDESRLRFFTDVADRVRRLPGVIVVAYANQFPLRGGWSGRVEADSDHGPIDGEADLQAISPDYFATLGMHIRQGRAFGEQDRTGAPGVAIVSQTFADRFFTGADPIGRVIRRDAGSPPLTVVGVVGEVRRDGKFTPPQPQVYLSASQIGLYRTRLSAFAVRTAGDPMTVVPGVRSAVAAVDSRPIVTAVRTLDEILGTSAATLRFHAFLLALVAVLAAVLAAVGVYGIVNYVVTRRMREIGVRIALGAGPRQIVGLMLVDGLRWVAAGIGVGVAVAAGASRVLASLLFETTPHDPVTFAAVVVVTAAVAATAAYIPARRGATCDPVSVLHGD